MVITYHFYRKEGVINDKPNKSKVNYSNFTNYMSSTSIIIVYKISAQAQNTKKNLVFFSHFAQLVIATGYARNQQFT